jgi:hypothetical protein
MHQMLTAIVARSSFIIKVKAAEITPSGNVGFDSIFVNQANN